MFSSLIVPNWITYYYYVECNHHGNFPTIFPISATQMFLFHIFNLTRFIVLLTIYNEKSLPLQSKQSPQFFV